MAIDVSKLSVNKNTPIPLYYQLKHGLLTMIHLSSPGDALPAEHEIVCALGISRSTVRQAFIELANEGYIHRDRGRGTFVSKPKVEEAFFQKLDSFNKEMEIKNFKPSTRVLDCKIIAGSTAINKKLCLPTDEKLIYLCRLRFADDEPLVYLETYLPYTGFNGLEKEDFVTNSLYNLLEEKYNCRVAGATRKIEAVPATPAEAKYLSIKPSAPIILARSTAFPENGLPVEYSVARYRGDRNSFIVELKR